MLGKCSIEKKMELSGAEIVRVRARGRRTVQSWITRSFSPFSLLKMNEIPCRLFL